MKRRQFIQWLFLHSSALFGSSVLSACQQGLRRAVDLPQKMVLTPSSEADPGIGLTEPVMLPSDVPPTSTPSYPDLVVCRGTDPEEIVRTAIQASGGMGRFISMNADVIIKPNICVAYHTYEYAATTNPWIVGALVKLAFEAGAGRVRVMDYPFGGTPEQAYRISGIQEAVLAAGGEMEPIAHFKFQSVEVPDPLDLKRCEIYDDVLKADVLINVPIAKHHSLARLTLGMKNLMGVIQDRPAMHRDIGRRLADLAKVVRPTLTIVDAVRILRAHGPSGGSLNDVEKTDTVIVSPDIVAADSYASTLFGLTPSDLSYVVAGTLSGLGRMDLDQMEILEVSAGG